MLDTTIIRFAYLPEVTLGRWKIDDFWFHTLEEPWRSDPDGPGGQRREGPLRESCIPDGDYRLVPHNGSTWRQVWRFEAPDLGVYGFDYQIPRDQLWGRSTILCHSGRDVSHILGCVLVGFGHRIVNGRFEVTDSAAALVKLREMLVPGTHHKVSIRPRNGTKEFLP